MIYDSKSRKKLLHNILSIPCRWQFKYNNFFHTNVRLKSLLQNYFKKKNEKDPFNSVQKKKLEEHLFIMNDSYGK